MKLRNLAQVVSLLCVAGPVLAQQQTEPPKPGDKAQKVEKVIITGSSIKRVEAEGALPVQVITREEIEKQGIVTAEQLIATLTSNGNGLDNLASNSDVVAGQARGNNGSTSANLRGQGSSATLVLLNGRRVAAYGLNGGVVDLNSIPFAAVDRVEVLKDGASAIYGTDAIGGVINFILRKDFKGVTAQAFYDKTQEGGGDIFRVAIVGGMGDLGRDGYNVMASFAHSENKLLRGDQRDFVNTFQSDRGLSVDTRGTPFATVFPLASNAAGVLQTILTSRATPTSALSNTVSPIQPGTTQQMSGGINVLNLPGQAGCNSIDGQQAYDYKLWITPSARWACAWDTGRAAAIQQPVRNTNLVSRATFNLGNHTVYAELTGSRVESAKTFSPNQISSSTSSSSALYNLVYPLNSVTQATYNAVFNAIAAVFPSIQENYGKGIAYRWRCMLCGNRQLTTTADTARLLLAAEGTVGTWDYRAGISRAYSDSYSLVGDGYFFNDAFIPALRSGVVNPFLAPGQAQSPEAVAAYNNASAKGVKLYGGRFTLSQADASASSSIYTLPAGDVMMAIGTDLRREQWKFNGDERDLANQRAILNVPFDNGNALSGVTRDIRAVYTEILIPVIKKLEVTVAGRQDHYTGFGNTTNPKVTFRYVPIEELLFRGSYNTGFRVPTFNQLFNAYADTPISGAGFVDPLKCPSLIASNAPGCQSLTTSTVTRFGGVQTLGPEKSKQQSVGFVWAPMKELSMNVDWWSIKRTDTIQSLSLSQLISNYGLFSDRFIRDSSGNLIIIDQSWINAGETSTRGLDVGGKFNTKLGPGTFSASIDGTYLLEKKSKLIKGQPWGPSEIANFTRSGDLGLRWKHLASFNYRYGAWSGLLIQQYSTGYADAVLPGVANGSVSPPNWNPRVDSYTLYHASVSYTGFKNLTITGGIKNLLNTKPPFSAVYDTNTGAGSSWEPRVADPRMRSFTAMVTYTFQ